MSHSPDTENTAPDTGHDQSHNHGPDMDHDCAEPELHAIYDGHGRLSAPGRLDPDEAALITRRITSYSVCVGVVLVTLKMLVWHESHSVGILSSLVHSGMDLFAALATFFGVRYAARKPDAIHSFGRGKAEGFIAVLQACLVLFAAAHIGEEAIEHFLDPHPVEKGLAALTVMAFAVALTSWLLMAQTHAIRSTGSVAIKGDRAHYIADLAANIAVIIGVAFAAFTPFIRADSIVAILISLWLVFTAYKVAHLAFNQLMDKELPAGERDYIRALAASDPAIKAIINLRTRASGPHVHIQMNAVLDDELSLTQGHAIIASATGRILHAFPAADITITPRPQSAAAQNPRFLREEEA